MNEQLQEYATLSAFDRENAGLRGGNQLRTKPATIEHNNLIGQHETFIVETIRDEEGDHIVLKYWGAETSKIVLPPKVVNTILRQNRALSAKARTNHGRAMAKSVLADPVKRAAMIERLKQARLKRKRKSA